MIDCDKFSGGEDLRKVVCRKKGVKRVDKKERKQRVKFFSHPARHFAYAYAYLYGHVRASPPPSRAIKLLFPTGDPR